MKTTLLICTSLVVAGLASAQSPLQPVYRITVTARSSKAISYQHRTGSTGIGFAGSALSPESRGDAKVEGKKGFIGIEAHFHNLPAPSQFGAEYLTYVLWAVTPEGRASNLGEILRDEQNGKLKITTELQAFALIVTAEPYFAVSQPSDVVVLENVVLPGTLGGIDTVDAKYELLQRGQYQHLTNDLHLQINPKTPLELYEARNAMAVARSSGATLFALDTFEKAEEQLKQAEAYQSRNAGSKPVTMMARQAVQTAEDARAIAVKRQDDELASAERQAGADREAAAERAKTAAQMETARIARDAEQARLSAEAAAGRAKLASDQTLATAQADAGRLKLANDADRDAAQAEAARLKLENDAKLASAQQGLASAQQGLESAARDRSELRAALLLQFNAILQTRDTARGLIVNMSDVLFDTAKFSLRPEAREKLAKVSGIVSAYPGLRLAVEGYTDSVGTDEYNQQLSEQRGQAVRQYLTREGGMPDGSVTSAGFGKNQPVASNDTAAGRQQNRRVELVISGDVIGSEIGTPIAAR